MLCVYCFRGCLLMVMLLNCWWDVCLDGGFVLVVGVLGFTDW